MKAFVTGCAGFVGSHLCEALLRRGDSVIGIDALTDNYPADVKRRNLSAYADHPQFEFRESNLVETDLLAVLGGVDCVFHTAGQPGVRSSWGRHFEIYLKNNILATQKILEAIKTIGKPIRVVFSSSSSIYGNTDQLPVTELSLPRPFSPYGTTKLAAEHLCHLYHQNFKVPVVSLRYFTVYGPRQRPDMGFHIFIKAMLENRPITVLGDGSQTRDFTYVDDIVCANLLAAEKPVEGEVFNIGGGSRRSLLDTFRILEEASNLPAKLEFRAAEKGDVKDTWADAGKAQKRLGFEPQVDLKTGLQRQFEWERGVY
ncbi:MAG: GDP-mannose 4,6-dehydratase [Candidatus Omnitrophica bacterium]|nr:GDP-mannose 4,6-dehydratase [Candidatus Omnitrophota bacterium]